MRYIPVIRRRRMVGLALGAVMIAGVWAWPTAPPHRIQTPFRAPATPYSAGHRGIDIATQGDGVVRAPADGIVRFAGVVVDRPVLSIEHAGGVVSSYEPLITDLRAGDPVRRGDPIGRAAPGHCADSCLHLGTRINGEYVSPQLFLGGVPRAILWPASGGP